MHKHINSMNTAWREKHQRPVFKSDIKNGIASKAELCSPVRFSRHSSLTRWALITACLLLSFYLLHTTTSFVANGTSQHALAPVKVLQPTSDTDPTKRKKHDPERWLNEHSDMNHHETGNELFNRRPKAAIISLVRNEELEGILQSMRQLERHWNRRYNYPWIFFSEKPFTNEFKVDSGNH